LNVWIFLQILLNILLVAALCACAHRFKKEDQFARGRESHINELTAFKDSLEKPLRKVTGCLTGLWRISNPGNKLYP